MESLAGAYIPEILHSCVENLKKTYLTVLEDEDFLREYDQLLKDYVGRPSPLYFCPKTVRTIRMQDLSEKRRSQPHRST